MGDDAIVAAVLMGKHHVKEVLLLVEDGEIVKPVGIVSAASVLQFYSEQQQKEHEYESPGWTRRIMVKGRRFFKRVGRT